MIGNEVRFRKDGMDDMERNSHIPSIQRVRKIHAVRKISAGLFDHERSELMYTYVRNRRGKATKRNNPGFKQTHLTADDRTIEKIEQDFVDYKSDIKSRLSFDRAQILHKEFSLE